jgi:DNA-binding XRE family transcriptional regulator
MSEHVYNRIRLLRIERGESRKELAEVVGVNAQTIGYLERGDYGPSLLLGLKLAEHFGAPVETLFSLRPFESVSSILSRSQEK